MYLTLQFVKIGLSGLIVVLYVALELESDSSNAEMQVVLIILRVRLVTPAFYVQTIARIVRIGLNGVIAVLHVALELKQERSHVVMQAVPIIQKIEHVTQMLPVLKIVPRVLLGVNGVLAMSRVVLGQNQEHVHVPDLIQTVNKKRSKRLVTQVSLVL